MKITWMDTMVSRGAEVRTDDSRYQIVQIHAEASMLFAFWNGQDGRWTPLVKVTEPERFGPTTYPMGREQEGFRTWVDNFAHGRQQATTPLLLNRI